MMTTLVVGASGATGKHLVEQLLSMNHHVKIVIRSLERIPASWKDNPQLSIIEASILEIDKSRLQDYIKDCDALASCLGHNLTLKGIFGRPRQLVTDATKLLIDLAMTNKPTQPIKFVLMNTTGNRNLDLDERQSFGEKIVMGLLRRILPPQKDNECAANFLRP